jgi:hypothetical protein
VLSLGGYNRSLSPCDGNHGAMIEARRNTPRAIVFCAGGRGGQDHRAAAGPEPTTFVAKVCQSCHDLQMVFDAASISREEWDMSLEEMTANGMNISADDRAKILAYLSTYLGPSPPK